MFVAEQAFGVTIISILGFKLPLEIHQIVEVITTLISACELFPVIAFSAGSMHTVDGPQTLPAGPGSMDVSGRVW